MKPGIMILNLIIFSFTVFCYIVYSQNIYKNIRDYRPLDKDRDQQDTCRHNYQLDQQIKELDIEIKELSQSCKREYYVFSQNIVEEDYDRYKRSCSKSSKEVKARALRYKEDFITRIKEKCTDNTIESTTVSSTPTAENAFTSTLMVTPTVSKATEVITTSTETTTKAQIETTSTETTTKTQIETTTSTKTTTKAQIETTASTETTTKAQTETTTSTETTTKAQTETTPTPTSIGQGMWGVWGSWSFCAVTCGDSLQRRYRTCNKVSTTDGNCQGDFVEEQTCSKTPCPVYGTWTTWSGWGDCSTSCGGGKQTRTRICNKQATSDIDCVGKSNQEQSCNTWNCPDCSQTCASGTLNADCDACDCPSNTVIGIVQNHNRAPLENATIVLTSAPYKVIATTGRDGTFTMTATCTQDSITVQKEKYIDQTITVVSNTLNIQMFLIEYPTITQQPKSRLRVSGDSVTFCCIATGNPAIFSYEWLKDGVLIDDSYYSNETILTFTNLNFDNTSVISCRANSPAGAVYSDSVTLAVRDSADGFCSDAYESRYINLPYDCIQPDTNSVKYDIGGCMSSRCPSNETSSSCNAEESNCCGVASRERRILQCDGYELPVYVAKSCECTVCPVNAITIQGRALGLVSGKPLQYGSILINGSLVTYTSPDGEFLLNIPYGTTRIVLKFSDTFFNHFLDTIKLMSFDENTSGSVYADVRMLEPNPPIEILSTEDTTIPLGRGVGSQSIAQITLPANAFYYANGTQNNGTVKASINFFDPRNVSDMQSTPGDFSFVDEEGAQQSLQSFGVLSVALKDQSGENLEISGNAEIELDAALVEAAYEGNATDVKLWGLNLDTGLWEELGQLNHKTGSTRRRRRAKQFLVGNVPISAYSLVNLDCKANYYRCYTKVRVYEQTTLESLSNFKVRIIHMAAPGFAFGDSNEIVAAWKEWIISNPDTKPLMTFCRDYNSWGYIEAETTDGSKLSATKNPDDYLGIATSRAIELNYNVTSDGNSIKVNFTSKSDGPFYNRRSRASVSREEHNHFRFLHKQTNFAITLLDDHPYRIKQSGKTGEEMWYPPYDSRFLSSWDFRICMIKIRATGNLENLHFRVISEGGTAPSISGITLGIREKNLDNGASCIEYKCSGEIPNLQNELETDYRRTTTQTLVKVIPLGRFCSVSYESEALKNSASVSNLGKTFYEQHLPKEEVGGIYMRTTRRYEAIRETINPTVQVCNSGNTDTSSRTMISTVGVAVTFSCL